jgi:hypothetical protein
MIMIDTKIESSVPVTKKKYFYFSCPIVVPQISTINVFEKKILQ